MIQLHIIRSLHHYYTDVFKNLDPSISETTRMTQRVTPSGRGKMICGEMSWLLFAIASVFIGSGRSQNVTMTYMFRRENVS